MSAHQLLQSAVCRLFQLSPFQQLREIHATGREGADCGSEVATLFSITGQQNARKVEGVMRIQKAFGTRAMLLAGLGAALLLATPVRAQQDMDPTYFGVNPGTPRAEHLTHVRTAANSTAAVEKVQAQPAAGLPATADATLEANIVRVTVADFAALVILFCGVILIARYATAATRRERRLPARLEGPCSPTPAAPAHGSPARHKLLYSRATPRHSPSFL